MVTNRTILAGVSLAGKCANKPRDQMPWVNSSLMWVTDASVNLWVLVCFSP